MNPISEHNYKIALGILFDAFKENPSLNWIVKQGAGTDERLHHLCEYCLQVSVLKNGAFISSDEHGVALVYNNKTKIAPFKSLQLCFNLIRRSIGFHRLPRVLYRQYLVKRLRPSNEHLYFFMIAVEKNCNGTGTIAELKNAVYQMSFNCRLPLYAETSLPKNKIVYERFGFKTYNELVLPGAQFKLWFLKKFPDQHLILT